MERIWVGIIGGLLSIKDFFEASSCSPQLREWKCAWRNSWILLVFGLFLLLMAWLLAPGATEPEISALVRRLVVGVFAIFSIAALIASLWPLLRYWWLHRNGDA